jgi:formiminotetrahydrofolate cyclodeaminase
MTATSLWDWKLGDFRDRTASADPTPGGGSVCAVSGTLGLGLVVMALRITLKRPASPLEGEQLAALVARAEPLLTTLTDAADDDVRAFDAYMAALALPKQTDEQKAERRAALLAASLGATAVPIDAARTTVRALELALEAARVVSIRILSDVAAGAELLGAAALGVLVNVDANLPGLGSTPEAESFRQQRAALAQQSAALTAEIRELVRARNDGAGA